MPEKLTGFLAVGGLVQMVDDYREYKEREQPIVSDKESRSLSEEQPEKNPLPEREKAFIQINKQHHESFLGSDNKIVQSEIRSSRADALLDGAFRHTA